MVDAQNRTNFNSSSSYPLGDRLVFKESPGDVVSKLFEGDLLAVVLVEDLEHPPYDHGVEIPTRSQQNIRNGKTSE